MAEKDATPVLATQTPQELAAQADVPVYPGALFPDKMTPAPKKDASGKICTYLVMSSGDSPSKVVKFYLKSPGHFEELKSKDGSQIQGFSPKGNLVLISVTVTNGLTMISVKSLQGS